MRHEPPERFPLRASEQEEFEPWIHEEEEEEEPLKGPTQGGDFERVERNPGSLYGDERGGQRPKKP